MTKILAIEDAPDIRELLVDILLDAGYDVMQAPDGAAALDLANRTRPTSSL